MNPLIIIGLALPITATYLLLQPARRAGASRACTVALAIGLGLGLASCTFYLALLLFNGARAGVIATDLVFLAGALWVWRHTGTYSVPASPPLSARERLLVAALLANAAAAATSFLANTLDAPHGDWDAWATWNLRARWLAGSGHAWHDAFAKPNIHGHYPLLLPGTLARLWTYAGANDVAVPAFVAAAYAGALTLLLYAGLSTLRGRTQAIIGALCLLGTPVLLRIAPWQYADLPLAFNLLAVVTLLAIYDQEPARGWPLLTVAGSATGLLAWTKNEGLMIGLGILAVRAVLLMVRRAPPWRTATWFGAGLLAPLLILIHFKLVYAPLSPQLTQRSESMMTKLATPERYTLIAQAAGYALARSVGPLLLALAAYALLLGRTSDHRARSSAIGVAAITAFAVFGYGFNYVVARPDLTWLLSHSIDRLLLQVWPSILLAFFLCVASPVEQAGADAAAEQRTQPPPSGRAQARNRRRK